MTLPRNITIFLAILRYAWDLVLVVRPVNRVFIEVARSFFALARFVLLALAFLLNLDDLVVLITPVARAMT